MKSRIEQLLSPERLRGRWEEPVPTSARSEVVERPAPSLLVLHARLVSLVQARFPAGDPVSLLVGELGTLLAARGADERSANRSEIDREIEAQLARIEDLADVAALARSRR
jgi:hypothetical protein